MKITFVDDKTNIFLFKNRNILEYLEFFCRIKIDLISSYNSLLKYKAIF